MIRYVCLVVLVLSIAGQIALAIDGRSLLAAIAVPLKDSDHVIAGLLLGLALLELAAIGLAFLVDREELMMAMYRHRSTVRHALQKLWSINPNHRSEAQQSLTHENESRREILESVWWSYRPSYGLASFSFVLLALLAIAFGASG
jgi:hypothetical protein